MRRPNNLLNRHPSADATWVFDGTSLWLLNLDAACWQQSLGHPALSGEERQRVRRLRDPLHQRRFAARCAAVRQILGALLERAPRELKFRRSEFGKPELLNDNGRNGGQGESPPLHFNLSHSENLLALAVAFDHPVGVDIEIVRPGLDFLAIAEAQFSANQADRLRQMTARTRPRFFYRLWTVNEALAKADGYGIAAPGDGGSLCEPEAKSPPTLRTFEGQFGRAIIVGALALAQRSGESLGAA